MQDNLYYAAIATYGPKIKTILTQLKEELHEEGFLVEGPFEMDCDTYWQYLVVSVNDLGRVEISLKLNDAKDFGEDEDKNLGNFSLDIVEEGSRIVGECTPFNYTDKCWVDFSDESAVAERFTLIKNAVSVEDICVLLLESAQRSQ